MVALVKPQDAFTPPTKSNEWYRCKLACEADLCYTEKVNIVVSRDAVNTSRLIHLVGDAPMNTVPPHDKKGNCSRRSYRTGPLPRPLEERFWEKVAIGNTDTCWEWQACTYHNGYGKFALTRSNPVYAHRLAYEFTHGPIPTGLLICHTCDNHLCCNPQHLFVGTQKDNMQDCKRKGRNSPPPLNRRRAS
jgi:hypothetical protein